MSSDSSASRLGDSMLTRFRVADLSDSVPGQFAGRLFADAGAEVHLIESEQGSPIRRQWPFVESPGRDDLGVSLLFRHLNTGKETLISESPVDAVLDSSWDAAIVSDRLQASQLRDQRPDLLVGLVEAFPPVGPYSGWRSSEIIFQALSGTMLCNGLPDREPLYGAGRRAEYAAGLYLYIALNAAHLARLRGGPSGQLVSTTTYEAAVSMEQNFSTQYAQSGVIASRGDRNRPRAVLPSKDGWVVLFVLPGTQTEVFELLRATHMTSDARFATWDEFLVHFAESIPILAEHSKAQTSADLLEGAREKGVVLAPIADVADLLEAPELEANGFWSTEADCDGYESLQLGPIFRSRRLDETDAAGQQANSHHPVSDGPLSGIRVLDFTVAWSGPMASRILGYLGADVVKVEGPKNPDGWRGDATPAILDYYPDREPGSEPLNRNSWFNTQNTNKRSLVVDIKDSRGNAIVSDLVTTSDVVMSNFSPGTMDRLGFGADRLGTLRPGIVVLEMPGFGQTGPLSRLKGLGPTMEAMSGISSLIGYPDSPPLGSGPAYLDPMGGLVGAAAVVTALVARAQDGSGRFVEVIQREAAMNWIGEVFLDCSANGKRSERPGNHHPIAVPHGAYPTKGADEWIAVAVWDESQWSLLCRVAEWTEWSELDAAGRLARLDEIENRLSAWTRSHEKHELAAKLQDRGLLAAPLSNGKDLYTSPQLRQRDWFVTLDHPSAGSHDYPGLPFEFSHTPAGLRQAAPSLGQHTLEILSELGWTSEDSRPLLDQRVISCSG